MKKHLLINGEGFQPWEHQHNLNGRSMAGCVMRPTDDEPEYIAFVPLLNGDKERELARLRLIALLPELVDAADTLNAAAVPTPGMGKTIKRQLRAADKLVRLAKDLLEVAVYGPDALKPHHDAFRIED